MCFHDHYRRLVQRFQEYQKGSGSDKGLLPSDLVNMALELGYVYSRDIPPESLPEDLEYWRSEGVYLRELKSAENDVENRALEQKIADLNQRYPNRGAKQTLYCPRGCQQLLSTAGWDECGACGSIMTPDAEDDYYNRLIAVGQCM